MKPKSDAEPEDKGRRGEVTSLTQLVVGGGLWSLAGRFGQSAIMLLGMMVLARLLTPSDFGVVATSVVTLLLVHATLEGLVEFPLLRVDNITEEKVRSLLWSGFGIATIFALMVFAIADWLEVLLGFDGSGDVFRAITPVFLVQVVVIAGRAILRRQHRFREVSRILLISAVIYVTTSVALAAVGFQYWSLVIGQLASYCAMAFQFGRSAKLSLRIPERFELDGLVSTAFHGSLSRVLAWFWTQIDTLAVSASSSAAATGFYTRAYSLSTQVKEPFSAIDHPVRQALIAARERDVSVEHIAVTILRLLTLASASIAALLIVMREPIIFALLGDQWGTAALPFALLVAGLPARVARQFLDSMSLASGRTAHLVLRHVFLSLLVGGSVAWAASEGIIAVAAAVTASLYVALVIPVEHLKAPGFFSHFNFVLAMMPGLGLSTFLILFFEFIRSIWPYGEVYFSCVVMITSLVLIFVSAIIIPERWLISTWSNRRNSFLKIATFWRDQA